jgi:guanylate kinase
MAVERGNLIVVSAPSGAGKSTIAERVLGRIEALRYSISCTTRKPRGAESDGIEYYFISDEDFDGRLQRGEFLEWAEVHGSRYGTLQRHVEEMLGQGSDVMLDIDVQGAEQIRRRVPEAVTVFILPPSGDALERRLRMRNLNDRADVERRLRNAVAEVRLYEKFKYVIVNEYLDQAAAVLEAIVIAERHRPERQRERARCIIETFGGESPNA